MTTSKVVSSGKKAKAIFIAINIAIIFIFIIWILFNYNCSYNIINIMATIGLNWFFWISFLSFVLSIFVATVITVIKCQIDVTFKGKSWEDMFDKFDKASEDYSLSEDSKNYFYNVWGISTMIMATVAFSYSLIVFLPKICP